MTLSRNLQSASYHRWHHAFCTFAACCVFLLIVAGALVTSNEAGLSVPDWPTSFGSLYRIPPMIGGVKFEHGHRMLAELIGLLTIVVAVWTQWVDERRWIRILGWSALGTVIAQGVLGGLTVLFYLPPAISTAHATLAQTFFCIMVSIAFFTSKTWVTAPTRVPDASSGPRLATLSMWTLIVVWLQLVMGAAFRHSGIRLLPHIVGAVVVSISVLYLGVATLKRFRELKQLATSAQCLIVMLAFQVTLGLASYLARVFWNHNSAAPAIGFVLFTVAHVACGALILATVLITTIQIQRHVRGQEETSSAAQALGRTVQA